MRKGCARGHLQRSMGMPHSCAAPYRGCVLGFVWLARGQLIGQVQVPGGNVDDLEANGRWRKVLAARLQGACASVAFFTQQSLQLVEYLLKSGPEHCIQAVQANVYAIQTLKGVCLQEQPFIFLTRASLLIYRVSICGGERQRRRPQWWA